MSESQITFDFPLSSGQLRNKFDLLKPIRNWFDAIEVNDRKSAHLVCKLIPAQCPFEREIKMFGRTIVRIPPMCKLNPLYDQFIGLRFRALCYLVDECGEMVV